MLVGCCGTAGRSLQKYSKEFNALELQSTFYRIPKIETVKKWRNSVDKNFVFTIKAYQGITHPADSPTWRKYRYQIKNIKESEIGLLQDTVFVRESWDKTISVAKELGAEVVVVQLPPSFSFSEENMKRIVELPCNEVKLAIEFRHKSWIERIQRVLNEISKVGAIVVWDPLKCGNLEQKTNYYRLHGMDGFTNYKYFYSAEELRKLALHCFGKEGYVFFNNLKMWENALMLKELIKKVRP